MRVDLQTLLYGNPHAMTTEHLVACLHILKREILERMIADAFPHIRDEWIAALDYADGDENLELDADAEDGADHEEENEHGTEIDNGEDEMDEGNLEPTLGWPEECGLYADMAALGQITMADDDSNDTDALPLAGSPLCFDGDGRRDARELIRKAQCKAGYWARRRALGYRY